MYRRRGSADRLRARCAHPDIMVARLGGDEFAILITGAGTDEATELAEALVREIVAPYQIEADRRLEIGDSIGVAAAPEHGIESEPLLSRCPL